MSTQTIPLTGPIELSCRIGVGTLQITADEERSEATVTLTPREPDSDVLDRAVVELRDRTLVVEAPRPRGPLLDLPMLMTHGRGREWVDVDISVPAGTAMRLSSYQGDVSVRGRAGGVDISTGASTIELDEVDGDLRLRYGSGACTVARVRSSVLVKGGSADLRLGDIGGAVTVACGTGNLDITRAEASVRMRTGSGTARIGIAEGDVDITSGSGDVSVGLLPGRTARLDVLTGSGQLHSDMPVAERQPQTGPSTSVRARTGSGDVHILRAATPAKSA
jgi:Putative adhesin